MSAIPNIFHFIFGLRPQTEPFHWVHYLCLESCRQVDRPDAIYFHCAEEPFGPLWQRIKPYLQLRPIERDALSQAMYQRHAEARKIWDSGWSYAHESDFLRLQILRQHGGIYADMDSLFVSPVPARLRQHDCVLGEEGALPDERGILRPSLCNAWIAAQQDSAFIARWLEESYEVFDGRWNTHSCQLAARLWERYPDQLRVMPQRYFYRHGWTPAGVQNLFENSDQDVRDILSLHLWAHLWWAEDRTDFTHFHAGLITEAWLRYSDSTYARLARRFLPQPG